MSCLRGKPNLSKSKSMESATVMAIGSSMMESGRRASFARTRRVSSAVSETPVSAEPSTFGVEVPVIGPNVPKTRAAGFKPRSAQDFLDGAQVAGGRRGLVALLAHGLADGAVQRRVLGHLPVHD